MSSARMSTMSGCMLVADTLKKEALVVKETKRKRKLLVDIFTQ